MEFKQLFGDDDAVSPVIGVILMVAITVILAAVIGTFVLGLGDQVSNTSPQASFTFDFDTGASGTTADTFGYTGDTNNDDGLLTITHDGGDSIEAQLIDVKGSPNSGGNLVDDGGATNGFSDGETVNAGTEINVWTNSDTTIRVTWESPNGGDTATLGKWTGPGA